jgi:hypothetical protein
MTIFPEEPKLEKAEEKDGVEIRRLVEDHYTFVPMWLGYSLEIAVKTGYKTDGASVRQMKAEWEDKAAYKQLEIALRDRCPLEDIESIIKGLIGQPWDMPRLLAAVPHDGLYGLKWSCRWLCDQVYRHILLATDYEWFRREIEYDLIRLVGWRNWNAVTKKEKKETKSFVSVRWVRTKKVPSIIAKLRKEQNNA